LSMLARKPDRFMSASELSKETGLKLYTVQKNFKSYISKE